MSRKNVTVQNTNGIGLGTVLFCIFLTLKLTGHIDWSWWVTSPLWIPLAILGVILCFVGLVVLCGGKVTRRKRF